MSNETTPPKKLAPWERKKNGCTGNEFVVTPPAKADPSSESKPVDGENASDNKVPE